MKLFTSFLLLMTMFFGCKVQENNAGASHSQEFSLQEKIFNTPYYSYKDFKSFHDYEVVSDTLIYAGKFHPQYSLLEIKNGDNHIVLLNKFSIDDAEDYVEALDKEKREVVDSIHIEKLGDTEIAITGCCTENKAYPEEIIAIIEKTDNLYVEKIKKAWRANLERNEIDEIYDLSRVECLNKFHKVEITEQEKLDMESFSVGR